MERLHGSGMVQHIELYRKGARIVEGRGEEGAMSVGRRETRCQVYLARRETESKRFTNVL